MRATDAIAAAKSAARAHARSVFAIEPIPSTLAQMSVSRPKGTRVALASRVSDRGRMLHVSAPATSAIGAIAQNAARQCPSPARTPPTTGPPSAGIAHAHEITVSMRCHRASGKSSRTMLCANAISTPPPSPCSARPPTTTGMLGAEAQIAAPTTNTPTARLMARRMPILSPTTELPALPRIEPTAYAVEAHA